MFHKLLKKHMELPVKYGIHWADTGKGTVSSGHAMKA
jgi:hypothetical protein